ncbi:MAG: PDGLE domain-containing protein [Armatimonadetes bacterium]|nr:PDGLE domain-containing protein [Armatimonadota bacterium]
MSRRAWVVLLFAAFIIAACLSPIASSLPDGLEWIAEHLGVASREAPIMKAPLADYTVPGSLPDPLKTALGGVLGAAVTFGLAWGVSKLLKRG